MTVHQKITHTRRLGPEVILNDLIEHFKAYIRNQVKLYQNRDLVEKKLFWSKMVNTLRMSRTT